jgi:hypothetical protein
MCLKLSSMAAAWNSREIERNATTLPLLPAAQRAAQPPLLESTQVQ